MKSECPESSEFRMSWMNHNHFHTSLKFTLTSSVRAPTLGGTFIFFSEALCSKQALGQLSVSVFGGHLIFIFVNISLIKELRVITFTP